MRGSIAIFLLIFSITVLADKPEWAGKGKATDEQKADHHSAMEAKADDMDEDADESREKAEKKKAKSGKSKSMDDDGGEMPGKGKMDQERKEMGKGTEMGQEKRQEHSKKWWRFWED